MKIPKKLSKKITSIALCTMLLSGGCLSTFTNVSYASTATYPPTYNKDQVLWKEKAYIKVRHRGTFLDNYMIFDIVATKDERVQFKYTGNLKSSFNYYLDDDYRVGFRNSAYYQNNGGDIKYIKEQK